ncbi:hypothetical protein Mspyr1_04770 [Mycolicibacterium gilvum Spyr1]|uniref:Uncharacterized protein n=1 Tax=Mycolicibacterium gilvum (strain DSM 45189 / LMG 24558 / Spyr1) TaxID=278137 RepID=E6TMU2_MYCSR|nr:hypothetical protein Mspyr1_04770 [Mycolicibacterium gilvum Spyr1]
MRTLPQESHADLGLVPDSDFTEDLRPMKNALGRCANTAEGLQNTHHANEKES